METEIIKSSDKRAIAAAVGVLKRGGIIIYPSESSYGIGADATNSGAVKRIRRIKSRDNKPISIIVSSVNMAKKYAYLDKEALSLVKSLMPGRLTLIVKKKSLPEVLNRATVGFRIPPHEFSLALLRSFGKPVTATSANKSGEPQLYRIRDVMREFSVSVDLIIDAGDLLRRKPSTIFNVAQRKVLREGPVKGRDIIIALKA